MPSFCQLGQKAYLYVDGGPFVFDGPLTVNTNLKQGETYYPNVWFWSFKAIVYGYNASISEFYYHTIDDTGEMYADMWIDCPVALTNYGTVSPWYTPFNPPRYAIGTPTSYGDRSVNAFSVNTIGQRVRPKFHSWVIKGARGWWGSGGHNATPILGEQTYELLANGIVIKTSKSPIAYTVKCGDRCPPGEKWDPVSRSCCCENMPSLIAQVRGAVNIARGIKP